MRTSSPMHVTIFFLLITLTACGGGEVVVEGSLAEPDAASEVWIAGSTVRGPVDGGAFKLTAEGGDTIDLGFTTKEGEVRMRVEGAPAGTTLRLDRVWFAGDVAFPGALEAEGGRPVTVNGLRMGASEAVPENVNVPATVLAVARDGTAILARPVDESLPDLRIVVTEASVVRSMDGDPVEADDLEFGDSLRVSGLSDSGYVVAAEIMVARRAHAAGGRAAYEGLARSENGPTQYVAQASPSAVRGESAEPGEERGRGRDKKDREEKGRKGER